MNCFYYWLVWCMLSASIFIIIDIIIIITITIAQTLFLSQGKHYQF